MAKEATVTPNNGRGHGTAGMADVETPMIQGRQLAVVMISVLLGILLSALDQTIVGPALPKIIGDLNGFEHYSWVITIYLLTSTISVPIAGKLSDLYGRKWFFAAGIVVFVLGSALCGLSADIFQLIVFRGFQGLGAGILLANAFAIIADLIPPANRGKWQGAFGGVFGLASVIGPTIGGYLTDNLSWRWVFYVNVPVGAIALAMLVLTFPHLARSNVKRVIDWFGAATLVLALTPLLLALSLGGTNTPLTVPFVGTITDWSWGSGTVIGLFVAAIVFLVAFILIEMRAKEAILPLDLFKNRIFTASVVTVFLTGVGLFGAVLYIPLFIQAVQGDSATSSGNAITPLMISVVIASVFSGQVVARTGKYRIIGIAGMAVMTLGMGLLYTMNIETSRLITITFMVIMGLGMGVTFPLYTLIAQNAFPMQRVGVVTAAVTFFRSMGSTVGVAVLGSVVNNQWHDKFSPEFVTRYNALKATIPAAQAAAMPAPQTFLSTLTNLNPQVLVGAENLAKLKTQLISHGTPAAFADNLMKIITDSMKPALFSGIQEAFLIATVLLAAGIITTAFVKEIPLRKSNAGPSSGLAEGGFESAAEGAGREMAADGMPGGSVLPEEDEPRLVGPRRRGTIANA
ncbi:MAG: MFS transporter [Chloroflexota bacterium]|nr:MFS transporter [Chloroflexota bacterium]